MKLCKYLAAAAMMAASVAASAQTPYYFYDYEEEEEETEFPAHYNAVTAAINPIFMYESSWQDPFEGSTLFGINLQYIHGWSVSSKLPFYIEGGVRLNFNFRNDEEYCFYCDSDYDPWYGYYYEGTTYLLQASLPLNLAYRFQWGNLTLTPYTGLSFKFNLLAKSGSESLFDYENWQRFVPGWQIGAAFSVYKFRVGVELGVDLMRMAPCTNSTNLMLALGVAF